MKLTTIFSTFLDAEKHSLYSGCGLGSRCPMLGILTTLIWQLMIWQWWRRRPSYRQSQLPHHQMHRYISAPAPAPTSMAVNCSGNLVPSYPHGTSMWVSIQRDRTLLCTKYIQNLPQKQRELVTSCTLQQSWQCHTDPHNKPLVQVSLLKPP